ncbi:hypothetical protein GJAV_G00211790 [Gymnothorax javanicus]|nr:hypothetical protein GJAV_G00211790 [Gymnothorax javanicus]
MTAVISTMSFKGLIRQNAQDGYFPEGSLRIKRRPWLRRSLNGESNGSRSQNGVMSFATLPRGPKQVSRTRSNSLVDYTDPQRTTVKLAKQDNETFGFEVQVRQSTFGLQRTDSSSLEMCTFVSAVQACGPAEAAGLTAGDVIVSINGLCTEGSTHQHIVNLIRGRTNDLTMETVSGAAVKRIELEKKLRLLKQRLETKRVELQRLTLQEQRLTCGSAGVSSGRSSLDSPMSLSSPASGAGQRFLSGSSSKSLEWEERSEDGGLLSVFGDVSPLSPDASCVFTWDVPQIRARAPRGRSSSSLADSSDSLSPSWDAMGACSLFGTLPRRGRKDSVRKRFMKFIPGLNRSVEEEEND